MKNPETRPDLNEFFDSFYFNVTGAPTGTPMTQEYVIKLLTKFIVAAVTAFWSLAEVIDFLRTKNDFKDFLKK